MSKFYFPKQELERAHRRQVRRSVSETLYGVGFIGLMIASSTADGDLKFFAIAAPVSLALMLIGFLVWRTVR